MNDRDLMKMMRLSNGQCKRFLAPIAYTSVLLIGFIDYLTGPEISLSLLYLFPVILVAWFEVRWQGILISVIAALTWLAADSIGGHSYSHPAIPYWNATVRLGFFIIVTLLSSRLRRVLDREHRLSKVDFLTGVANGRSFFQFADLEIKRSRRYKHPFSVVYIDLDSFKDINDSFGHLVGDALLRSVAETIQNSLRVTDFVARLGGDEFVILLPETGPEQSKTAISKTLSELSTIMQNNNWPITFSTGMVTFLKPPQSVDEMIKRADDLMYVAKRSGKGAIKQELFGEQ